MVAVAPSVLVLLPAPTRLSTTSSPVASVRLPGAAGLPVGPAIPWQWSVAVALIAVAVLLSTGRPAAGRLRSLAGSGPSAAAAPPAPLRRRWVVVGALAAGALAGLLGGVPAGLAVGGLAGAGAWAGARAADRRSTPADAGAGDVAAGWELVAVGLEAGLPVAVAVSAAAGSLAGATGAALRRVGGLLELGADPAGAWRTVEHHPALAAFARAAGRSSGTGAALAGAARAEAERLRAGLADAAQERAQRAAVLITGPLGLCFLPAFLALGIAPVVVGLAGAALAQW